MIFNCHYLQVVDKIKAHIMLGFSPILIFWPVAIKK